MILTILTMLLFVVMAIISAVGTVYTVMIGLDVVTWTVIWTKIDLIAIGVFLVTAIVTAGLWLLTTYIGYSIWQSILTTPPSIA